MARIEPRRTAPSSRRRSSFVWRGTKAVGASAGRQVRRLAFIAFVALVVGLFFHGVVVRVRTPGVPSRTVEATEGSALQRLRQADLASLELSEGDLTAAFAQATAFPTFPFADGQVAVLSGELLEIFGHLKHASTTATILARPFVREGRVDFDLDRITIGEQSVPRFLFPLLSVGTVDQAALFANRLVPPLAELRLSEATLTLVFP